MNEVRDFRVTVIYEDGTATTWDCMPALTKAEVFDKIVRYSKDVEKILTTVIIEKPDTFEIYDRKGVE